MSVTVPSAATDSRDPARPGARASWLVHGLAAAVVVGGVVLELSRPLAPDLGPAPSPQGVFDAAYMARAAAYREPLYAVMVAALVIRLAIALAVAFTGHGRRLTARVVARIGAHRPARAAAAVITGIVVGTDLVLFPLAFWAGFVHDGRFGLRTQGFGGWLYDWAVFHLPVWLAIAALVLLGYATVRRWGRLWPAVAGVVAGVLGVGVAFVSPLLLEPLTYSFTPLEQGPVRAEVERVLAAADLEVDAILVADASRRSVRQNAYISGLGASQRVVLFDTLVDERPVEEVGVVVAHELAHRRHQDLLRANLLAAAGTVVVAYAVSALVRRRTRRGHQAAPSDPAGAPAVLLLVLVLVLGALPVQSFVSRRAEAAADLASLEYTRAPEVFARMQQGLAETNLAQPRPPQPVVWLWASHPSPMARIGMARWWSQR
jgi:STE24 endopeptidase